MDNQGKAEYYAELADLIGTCLEEEHKHAVMIYYDSSTGQVRTYSVNAPYDIVQLLVGMASRFITDDQEERVVN